MLDLSILGEDDRMGVLHHLQAVRGEVDEAALILEPTGGFRTLH
jgi:hypothetical protein